MNKVELSEAIANKVGLTKNQIIKIIDVFEEVTTQELKKGQEVTITGFGTFSARHRSERMGVNPQKPSEKIKIHAVTVPKFKAGKALKDALKS
jgi:DNA-binding protein HU-beta